MAYYIASYTLGSPISKLEYGKENIDDFEELQEYVDNVTKTYGGFAYLRIVSLDQYGVRKVVRMRLISFDRKGLRWTPFEILYRRHDLLEN